MLIRSLTEKDILACATIIATTPLWQGYGVTPEKASQRLSDAYRANAPILVADDGTGHVIGVLWIVERGAFDLSPNIRWLAVDATARSQGVGQQLLSAAEAQVQPPARDLFLLCADSNTDAQRFYERNGYSRVGTITDYVIPGVAEYIYRKRVIP
jgi:ribosomal protein S18 acetylase RimI-like enzyme